MGKQAYVRLAEQGEQQNPVLHISAAGGKSAAKSLPSSPAWVPSTVSVQKASRQQVETAIHSDSSVVVTHVRNESIEL